MRKITLILWSLALPLAPMAVAQELILRLEDSGGQPLTGAVMELLSASPSAAGTTAMREAQVDQRDKEFVPTVTTIVAGGSVSFPNSDDILHHVYSFSAAKTFDTPLYGSDASSQYRELFDAPGVVEIGCNIHDWMLAYIYVGQSELMAISDEAGVATLTELPPGEYTLRVWHARLDAPGNSVEEALLIEAGQTLQLQKSFDLVRDRRVRRAPSANRKRYR